jgi:TP901 family phage tail tape measure protein
LEVIVPEVYEKLGIEIAFKPDASFTALDDLLKRLTASFEKIGVAVKGPEAEVDKLSGKFQALANVINILSPGLNATAEDAKKLNAVAGDTANLTKMAEAIKKLASANAESNAAGKVRVETLKAESKSADETAAIFKKAAEERSSISKALSAREAAESKIRIASLEGEARKQAEIAAAYRSASSTIGGKAVLSKDAAWDTALPSYLANQSAANSKSSFAAMVQAEKEIVANAAAERKESVDKIAKTEYEASQHRIAQTEKARQLANKADLERINNLDIIKRKEAEAAASASSLAARNNSMVGRQAYQAAFDSRSATPWSAGMYKPAPGGGVVQSSVNTDVSSVGLANARVAAEAYARSLTKIKEETDKAKAATVGLHVTFGNMITRLVEFYSARKVLFFISAEFSTATHSLMQFNQELHDTAAIANASSAQMDRFSEAAMSIAKNSKFSAAEVMKSMKTLAQAGVSADELPAVARTVDFFATGTGATPEQAAKVLTTTMNVWGVEAEKTGRISNLLTAALNASKLEVGELSTAFNYLANQSAIFDKTMEETSSTIAVLANQGLQASTIGTSVSGLLAKLAAPAPRFRALLKEFGIGLDEIAPRAHSFAQIVKRFEDAAIPAERIMGALDQRIGRALVTSMQAGSEKFELMTQRITNSNAAAVAYNESMKGVLAQINVLRGEAVATLDALAKSSGLSFSTMKEGIQDMLVGLRSAQGEFLVFATVIIGAITAIGAAFWMNPVLAGLTVLIGGVLWGISKLGEANRELAKDIDKGVKASAEQSAVYQRKSDGLYTMLSLVDKTKVTEEGYLIIQDQNVKKIRELVNTFPDVFAGLDTKKMKYEQLTDAILNHNKARDGEINGDILRFNNDANKIATLKQNSKLAADYEKEALASGEETTAEFKRHKADIDQKIKEAEDVHEKDAAANIAPGKNVTVFLDPTGTKRAVKDWEKDKEHVPGEPAIVPEKPVAAKVNPQAKNDETFRYWAGQQDDKDGLDALKRDKVENEKIISDKTKTLEERTKAFLEIEKVNYLSYKEEQHKEIDILNKKFADTNGMLWDTEGQQYRHPTELAKDGSGRGRVITAQDSLWNKAVASGNVGVRNDRANSIHEAAAVKLYDADQKAVTEFDKGNATVKPLGIFNSDSNDKQAERRLVLIKQAVALRKEDAKSAQDIIDLDNKILQAEIECNEQKLRGYNQELQSAEVSWEKAKGIEAQVAWVEKYQLKLEGVREKKDVIEGTLPLQKKKLMDDSPGGDGLTDWAMKGADKAVIGMGSLKSNTEQLGTDLTNTLGQGFQDTMNGMIDALSRGKNAWDTFKTGLSGILKSIAEELQKYIIKLLVLAAIKTAVKAISGYSAGGEVPAGGDMGGDPTEGYANGGLIQRFATGGLALNGGNIPTNIGIKGKDSVPAMLMPGEFVLKKSVVDKYGVDYFQSINAQKFAEGGIVGPTAGKGKDKDKDAKDAGATLNIINVVDPTSIPKTTDAEIINVIRMDLAKNGPLTQQFKSVLK